MFLKRSAKNEIRNDVIQDTVTGIIDSGCEFNGKLSFEGVVRIGGKFKGDIYSADTLIVSEGAEVEAEIEVDTVIIHGKVKGNILAKKKLIMHSPAEVTGKITTPNLSIDEGVVFDGTTKMATEHSSNIFVNRQSPEIQQ